MWPAFLRYSLLQWSGTKPAVSLSYACTYMSSLRSWAEVPFALLSSFPTFFCLGCRCLHMGQWGVAGRLHRHWNADLDIYVSKVNLNLLPVILDFLSFISETNPNTPRNSSCRNVNNSVSLGAWWGHFPAETNCGGWRKNSPYMAGFTGPSDSTSKGNSRSHCVII